MIASAFLALALFAAPDAATGGAPASQPAAAAPKPKKVCVKQPDISGSRLAKTVCRAEQPKAEAPAQPTDGAADKPAA